MRLPTTGWQPCHHGPSGQLESAVAAEVAVVVAAVVVDVVAVAAVDVASAVARLMIVLLLECKLLLM